MTRVEAIMAMAQVIDVWCDTKGALHVEPEDVDAFLDAMIGAALGPLGPSS